MSPMNGGSSPRIWFGSNAVTVRSSKRAPIRARLLRGMYAILSVRDYDDPARSTRNTYQVERGSPMANVVKKHSISFELAQKMVDEAVAKARELGVTENVAILDDGGNLKAFTRMDGAPILCIEMAQNKAYTALFGVSTQDFFNFIQGDPSLLAGIPTLARVAAWGGGFPIKVNGEVVGAIGLSGAPTVQNDVDCARAALALVPDRP